MTSTPTPLTPTEEHPADAVTDALAAHPGATAAELAEAVGVGRSTAAKRLATLEYEGRARRTSGGREGGRRLPDRWHLADTDVPDPPLAPRVAGAPKDGAQPAEVGADRLGKGALRVLVYEYLAAHPEAEGLGPTAIAKALGGKSSGAVGNALGRLEEEGTVRLTQDSPRRYRLTTP